MKHRSARAAVGMGVAALALSCAPACAHAEPQQPQPVTPQRDAPCSETLAGAMARLADGKTNLVCTDQGGGYRWPVFTSPYPLSDRWLTYGPDLLHGQGMRNPELMSGRWTGKPQEPDAVCWADQVTALGAGVVSPPESVTGEPGKPLEFSVSPTLFTISAATACGRRRDAVALMTRNGVALLLQSRVLKATLALAIRLWTGRSGGVPPLVSVAVHTPARNRTPCRGIPARATAVYDSAPAKGAVFVSVNGA